MDALLHLVIYLVFLGCVIGLLLYLVSIAPIPEPFKGWLWFAVMAFAIIAVIYVLIGMMGSAPSLSLPRSGGGKLTYAAFGT
jgi:hypothetical protein